MNVNKKLDRFRQWGKEKVGAGGDKTQTSDDFKALETEMNLRHEGMEKMHGSMNIYVKSLTRKSEADGKDKYTPLGLLSANMVKHGQEFEEGNKFGESLLAYGQANQRIVRMQDSYAQTATSSWLESCDRSLAQLKDYQSARKKLESRRLAYDASLAKSVKVRKDDFRFDEELRSQKAKYEESTEEVSRRMQDIIEAEADATADLSAFLEAQLAFHERAAESLRALQRSWPVGDASPGSGAFPRRIGGSVGTTPSRSRADTRLAALEDEDDLSDLPAPPSRPRSRAPSGTSSPLREPNGSPARPAVSRTASHDATLTPDRPAMARAATATAVEASASRSTLRSASARADSVFADDDDAAAYTSAPISRNTSWGTLGVEAAAAANGVAGKKGPPPPPPSRKTKPPPPPPPMRKVASASIVPRV